MAASLRLRLLKTGTNRCQTIGQREQRSWVHKGLSELSFCLFEMTSKQDKSKRISTKPMAVEHALSRLVRGAAGVSRPFNKSLTVMARLIAGALPYGQASDR